METRERAVAFVVARLGSTRLAAKHLRTIGDRPMLAWVVERLRRSSELDEVVLTTVAEPENEPLREFAREAGIDLFWYEGDVEDVTGRLRRAAEDCEAEICVLISADSPLVHTPGIDLLVSELRGAPDSDIVGGPRRPGQGPPPLLNGISVARRSCWQLADDLSDTPELRQHQFPVIARREEEFRIHHFALPQWYYQDGPRLSVDTWADLEFMNAVHERLLATGESFDLGSLMKLLEREPWWTELDVHVRQLRADDRVRRVLFVAETEDDHGFHRLRRDREVALQLVERAGWPVTFVVDDLAALEFVRERGLAAVWGALDRPARPTPIGERHPSLRKLCERFDQVLVDAGPARELTTGWRGELSAAPRVTVLDSRADWTAEADLRLGWPEQVVQPRELSRRLRDAERLGLAQGPRDLDLLSDLEGEHERQALQRFVARNGLTVSFATAGSPEFFDRLSRARVFLSRPGPHVHGAIALGTWPVAWVRSDDEHARAEATARELGLPPVTVRDEHELANLHALLSRTDAPAPTARGDVADLVAALVAHEPVDATRAA